jgi:restriction endonuclease S subunit
MQREIQEIATIRSGAYIKEVPDGSVYYIQVGNFNRDNGLFVLSKPSLALNSKTEKHLLMEGDILFAAKGTSNFCSVFHQEMGKCLASSSFLVISIINKSVICPDYLCWVLNREDTLAFFKTNAVGSSMPSIGKALIEEYEISIPPIQVQKKIVEISQLQLQEQRLYNQIAVLRNQLTQKQLIEKTKLYGA